MTGIRKFYTFDDMKIFALKNGLDPNAMLWSGDKTHENIKSVYRQGSKPKDGKNQPGMQLSWEDIGKDSADGEKIITPKYYNISFESPHGISMFLQPNLQEGEELFEHQPPNDKQGNPTSANAMKKRAKTDFSPAYLRHFYEMPLTGSLPPGLVLIYDGGLGKAPYGHVTLSVQFPMTVGNFNGLIAEKLIPMFTYIGPAVTGRRRQHA